ncbi:MAG: aminotransferase class V-fold PLP-dependent enzyme [Saprospiraceae bacterium]|nr:aminotransferase class V-fold PLP-dependent enzyme [Saprospiraceae bacterium]
MDQLETIKKRLKALAKKSKALEPSPSEREKMLEKVRKYLDRFIQGMPEGKAYVAGKPEAGSLQILEEGQSLSSLLKIYRDQVERLGINPASGGHLGYIPGGGIWLSGLGDFIADVTNEYAGMYFGSPGAVTMEDELLDWMKEVFGFPSSAIGNLTSGGSIANLIALTSARDKMGIKADKIPVSVIYTSPQVHHCIQKALRIIGLEDILIRYISLDENHRMDVKDLRRHIEVDFQNGLNPFMVIASAGTTDTGAIDPLERIAEVAQAGNLWYHVDAAYGGFFILVDEKKDRFKGIEKADSLVIDPHKGLFLPYGTGAVLVKDKDAVFHSHHYTANYMQDAIQDDTLINPADVSPELTKHFRGMRMWLPLQLHGIKPFKACLEEKLWLTEYFRERLKSEGFELGPQPDLSVSYFWYPSKSEDQNVFNDKLLRALHKNGDVFLSSTVLDGKFVIRMAILAFRTKKETIDRAMDMILAALQKLH